MKVITISLLLLTLSFNVSAQENIHGLTDQKTWTYTYLIAHNEQKDDLRLFLEKNWFVMDSIAVQQGLFNDYYLIENTNIDTSRGWDFIVAVEYFTRNTFSDIQDEWSIIRRNHETVLINGKNLRELGQIVNLKL